MSPWKPLPGEKPDPRPVKDFLPGLVKSLGAPAPDLLHAVFARWDEIVGASIAAHAWPLRLQRKVLHVGVDQPVWATQLSFLRGELVRKIAAETGDATVEKIEIRVVPKRQK